VGCALVPIAVVASVSYRHVTRHLRSQSATRLDHATEALAHAIFERLLLLDATLKAIPPRAIAELDRPRQTTALPPSAPVAGPKRRPVDARLLSAGLDLLASRRFLALTFVEDGGRRTPVFGRLDWLPEITAAQQADVALGVPLVLTRYTSGRPGRIFILRHVGRAGEPQGTLVGEVSPLFLWGALDLSMPSPDTRITIADDSGRVLFASTASTEAVLTGPFAGQPDRPNRIPPAPRSPTSPPRG
jgi:hypothetical protein